MRGDVDLAQRQCTDASQLGAMAQRNNASSLAFTQWWVRQRYKERFMEAGAAITGLLGNQTPGPPVTARARAVAALQVGDTDKAKVFLEHWLRARPGDRMRDSEWLPPNTRSSPKRPWPSGFGSWQRSSSTSFDRTPTASVSKGSAPRSPDRRVVSRAAGRVPR